MRAAYLTKIAGPEALEVGDIPEPQPGPGEIIVKVQAAGVTPGELLWQPTFHARDGSFRPFPVVPCHEFSGAVHSVGNGVTGLNPGDPIFGLNDWYMNGALAQYCLSRPAWVAPRPTSLHDEMMAVTPISALTAWQGLFDRCALVKGQRVLIHGGAGAVGGFAVQLARWRGACVIATASSQNRAYVASLGAEIVVDYQRERFEEMAGEVDAVFDTVGGDVLDRSWKVLKPEGRAVTIVGEPVNRSDPRARGAFFIVEPNRGQLVEIARLMSEGSLKADVDCVLPLAQAREAFARAAAKSKRGKVAIQVSRAGK
jgi:NADPH:quinone reductase-like Zn-dependent oxidoreductase